MLELRPQEQDVFYKDFDLALHYCEEYGRTSHSPSIMGLSFLARKDFDKTKKISTIAVFGTLRSMFEKRYKKEFNDLCSVEGKRRLDQAGAKILQDPLRAIIEVEAVIAIERARIEWMSIQKDPVSRNLFNEKQILNVALKTIHDYVKVRDRSISLCLALLASGVAVSDLESEIIEQTKFILENSHEALHVESVVDETVVRNLLATLFGDVIF